MKKGVIFSIEEFAIHDGPGIRTTVFLKGCPLRCAWCHSPEGQAFQPQIVKSPNGCLGCGACIAKGKELTGTEMLIQESISVCPRNLLRVAGECYTSEELVEKLLKNASFLNASGGGVTFSGGEPLAQSDFLNECLVLLKGKLHRALQTSGFCAPSIFEKTLKSCDYVLFDLKLMDHKKHLAFCGADNKNILENYRILANSGVEFITRIPLIPTVNDTAENITATAKFMRENGVKKVELLPYHPFAGSKYALLGRPYHPPFDESLPPVHHMEIFQKHQIEVNLL